jgi:uncharacterized protein (TIGR02444 family)
VEHGAHNATLCLDNPFWRYSLQQYAVSGCSDFLLLAQDQHGLNINVILYLGWLAHCGKVFDPSVLDQALLFSEQVIEPLRLARKAAKTGVHLNLYEHIKKSELMAEQQMQAMLYDKSLTLEDMGANSINVIQQLENSLESHLPLLLNNDQGWKTMLIRYLRIK